MERHIRYVVDGYTTLSEDRIKKALESYLKDLDDEIKVSVDGYEVSLSFRTREDAKLMTCREVDKVLSKAGVMAVRIIASRVVTYEYNGPKESPGGASNASNRKLDVNLLIAVLSGLAGYAKGNLIEKSEGIIYSCEKRNGRWVRI